MLAMESNQSAFLGRRSLEGNKKIGVIGFEPTTPATRTQCATRLRYTPNYLIKISKFQKNVISIRLLESNCT